MGWKVVFSGKAAKQVRLLPSNQQDRLKALIAEIQVQGPVRGNWPNYSKLSSLEHHCHLSYRYVACWREADRVVQIVEVYYVGSREKAPYCPGRNLHWPQGTEALCGSEGEGSGDHADFEGIRDRKR